MEHARPPLQLHLEGGPASRSEAWRKWHKQFCVFLKASGVYKEAADVQANLLINLIGSEGYDVYTTFNFTKEESRECLSTLVKKFNEHFEVKQNTTMARFKFFTRGQETGESIDEYVTALKLLAQHCEFGHLEEGLVRDRIVCGVSDSTLRDRLLRAEDLTLVRAVKICQAKEMSTEEKRQIEGTKTGDSEGGAMAAVDAMYARRPASRMQGGAIGGRGGQRSRGWRGGQGPGGSRGNSSMKRPCSACASDHWDDFRCPAKNAMCFWCSERGHFKKMCPKYKKRVYQIEEVDDGDDGGEVLYYVSSIYGDRDSKDLNKDSKWFEILLLPINGMKEKFKLDSGSDLNVISLSTYKRLGFHVEQLSSDGTRAQSFCLNYLPIVGSSYIDLMYKNHVYSIRFVIADLKCASILGKYACEDMGLIKRVLSVNVDQYDDLFHGLGKLPGKYTIVIEKGAQPSVCPVRKIPIGVRNKLLAELNRMEKMGVIRKVSHPTPWVNAIVVAAKKDGTIRVCLDPRPLNRVVRRAHYPLPTLTDIASKLEGARYFSKLDARSGFWMTQIDDASADLCTFGTPFGRYQFLRLPYGINCASEVFHAKIRQVLEDLDGVDSFIDDVIVWGSTRSQHDERLKRLMDRARQVGIKFNKEKCMFGMLEVRYLGHTFSSEGMRIDKDRVKAIQEMTNPKDRSSLERFLGMINYLSRYIPNYSEIASPLRSLLKKESEWIWDEPHECAIRRLKDSVCGAPTLALYSAREPVLVSVDASSHALGAVLLQTGRPVEFASATLTDTQCRYAQIEKELLAIVYGLERFHQYVFGRQDVTVETDHKPLEALFKKSLDSIPARLQRMMLRIQGYSFNVIYKPGKYMYVADALSRAPLQEKMKESVSDEIAEQSCFLLENVRFSEVKMRLIRDATVIDKECQAIIKYIQEGWPNNKYEVDECVRGQWSYGNSFEYVDGIIFKDDLVYIPRQVRPEMLKRLHDGHLGIDKCKRHAREVMFWPGMSRDVEATVRRCSSCAERAHRPTREPLIPHHIPDMPWVKVGSDVFQYGKKYFLILVDYFSNFIEVNPLTNIGTKAVVSAMKDQFARHGIPEELVTDNGPAYVSKEFRIFTNEWGFHHTTSSPNYPQSNGLSERSVQTIKNILVKSINSGSDFYLGLLNFRVTPRYGISSPSELLMGRRPNTRLPSRTCKLKTSRDNSADYQNIMRNKEISRHYYDLHSKPLPDLQPGQRVIVADDDKRKSARVLGRAAQPRSYFVTDPNTGRRYRRNRRHLITIESTDIGNNDVESSTVHKDDDNWSSAESDDVEDTHRLGLTAITENMPTEKQGERLRRPAAVKARQIIDEYFKST